MFHRGVWKDPRYLEQKREALRRDFRRKKYIYHRRDLMPKCVIELVRHWYPNLQDKIGVHGSHAGMISIFRW